MELYAFLLLVISVVCDSIKFNPEFQRNILNFGYGINYKYEGMLAHSFDRFYIVTKFMLPSVKDIKFSNLNFVNNVIPVKIPSHPYVLVNRSVLCNCGIEADSHHLFEWLAACDSKHLKLIMYFIINLAFSNYLELMPNMTEHKTLNRDKILTSENIKLNRNYLWDTLEINWDKIKLAFNSNEIKLPKLVMIKIQDKIRVRRIMSREMQNFHIMVKQGMTWYKLETV